MLGATTLAEYRKYIEKDPALERRFRPVLVEEPNAEEALAILRGIRGGLERHHHMKITDEALQAAVEMSRRYLPELFLPDKAIDLLDEGLPGLTWRKCGRPRGPMSRKRNPWSWSLATPSGTAGLERAAELRDRMHWMLSRGRQTGAHGDGGGHCRGCIGPDGDSCGESGHGGAAEAPGFGRCPGRPGHWPERSGGGGRRCSTAGAAAAWRITNRPIACMLFTGPTGVGKTELCRALAQELLRQPGGHDPAGYDGIHGEAVGLPAHWRASRYVGHEEGGVLTEKVRRRPYSLILFDELEKAHPDVTGILLQVMEDGVLTDSLGRQVSF
ncbi:MAG: AAA family ATPase [Oscillospiraceae bacterium]